MVNFRNGEVVFKKPERQELMTIDSSEKRLLIFFRKMDVGLKKVCVRNIQYTVKSGGPSLHIRSLEMENAEERKGLSTFEVPEIKSLTKKRGRPGRKRLDKKLLKEKIDRLKMISKSISRITVK